MDTLTFLANESQIAGLLIAVGAAVIAIKALDIAQSQLRDAVSNTSLSKKAAQATEKSARGQFILAIDAAFRPYDHVREAINNPSLPDPSLADRQRYIAVCERLGYLIEWDLLDTHTVNDLYGDRIRKLLDYYDRKEWNFLRERGQRTGGASLSSGTICKRCAHFPIHRKSQPLGGWNPTSPALRPEWAV
jgi:hypothetical protein